MKRFFLYPHASLLGVCAFIIAAKFAEHFSEWYWKLLCYSIASAFNFIVTYDDEQVIRNIKKRLETKR